MEPLGSGGRESARRIGEVLTWDPLVRLTHWSVAVLVLLNGAVLEDDGQPHVWVGYAVLGLVAARLLWGFVGPVRARFASFPPSLSAARMHVDEVMRGRERNHASHNPLGALMAYNLWTTLLAICATGLMMESVAFFGVDWVEEAHEALFGWLMISVGLHVAGVVLESLLSGRNLVRAMVGSFRNRHGGSA